MGKDAIYPRVKLISRAAKRKYELESEKLIEHFEKINQSFIDELFSDDIHFQLSTTYQSIYQSHLQWWEDSYEWYKQHGKLKYTIIDSHWFSDNYYPKEKY